MTDEAVKADLAEYEREKMLEVWEDNGRRFGFLVSWGRHQRVREADPAAAKGKKFKTNRKTPVSPSVRPFGTMVTVHEYPPDASIAFMRKRATLPFPSGYGWM